MIIKKENNRRCEIFLAESFAIFVDQTVSVCFGLSMTHDAQISKKKVGEEGDEKSSFFMVMISSV